MTIRLWLQASGASTSRRLREGDLMQRTLGAPLPAPTRTLLAVIAICLVDVASPASEQTSMRRGFSHLRTSWP